MSLAIDFSDVSKAARRLRGVVVHTPVVRSDGLDRAAGNALFLKCENLQRMGAFKFRGAYNALAQLSEDERRRGVVAFSSGNHAQGVALAAKLLDIPAIIVMPTDAPRMKLEATQALGAKIVAYDRDTASREAIAAAIVAETGAALVPPYDDPRVIAGQGTAALELFEDIPDLDVLLVPLGGGGLLSGCAVAAKALCPQVKVYGVEPEAGNDWWLSWQRGEPVRIDVPKTIADALRTTAPGSLTWPVVRAHADGVLLVSEEEIADAVRCLLLDAKLVAEPAGATAAAAALAKKLELADARVGVIISGGNIEIDQLLHLVV